MAHLDKLILKELDNQKFGASRYALVMSKLDNREKKCEFLNYLAKNRNTILSPYDIVEKLKSICETKNQPISI